MQKLIGFKKCILFFFLLLGCKGNEEFVIIDLVDAYFQKDSQPPKYIGKLSLPENFSELPDIKGKSGFVTFEIEIPKKFISDIVPLAINAGRISDVTIFELNGINIGGFGTFEPYTPGAMRPFIKILPTALVSTKITNKIKITIYAKENHFPLQIMDSIKIGMATSILNDFFQREIISHSFLTLYILVGIYYLFLYFKRKQDNYNLYFSLFAITISIYWFVSETYARDWVFGTHIELQRKVEHFFLYWILPFFLLFLSRYFHGKYDKTSKVAIVISIMISFVTLFSSIQCMRIVAKFWQVGFLLTAPYFVFYIKKKISFKKKDANYFLAGISALLLCSINDILVSLNWINTPRISSYSLSILVIGLVILLGNNFIQAHKSSEDALAYATRLNLELSKKNIQPHFLMNSINASMFLIEENPKKAIDLLNGLADELRETIRLSKETIASLKNEVELCRNHLNIMSLRKEKKFTFKIIGNIEGVYLPPLILLTLVENGITHGYRKNKEGEFCLTISKETDCIELILFNDGETNLETKKGTGTGIKYIEVRLQEVYKKNWIFEYGKVEGGYRVRLKFPQVSSYLI